MSRSTEATARRNLAVPFLAVLASLLLLAGAGARAQDADSDLSTFVDRVDVNVVNLEVFVTDRDGNRVNGLGRDDFELKVDGKPVELTNFFVSRPAPERTAEPLRSAASATPEAAAEAPPGAGGADPAEAGDGAAAAPAPRRPLYLMAYVDHVNILPGDRKRVLDELRAAIDERAARGDFVMLVGYDGSLEVVQPFTHDVLALERGVEELGKAATKRQLADTQLRIVIRKIRQDVTEGVPNAGAGDLALYTQERLNEATASYKALLSAVRGLAGLSGRKALLYVSDGIPRRPGADLASILNGGAPPLRSGLEDLSRLYGQITREANAHEVTLYTLDARGPGSNFFTSAEAGNVSDFGNADAFAFERDSNLQEPLMEMAEQTGGAAILNTSDIDGALDGLLRDFQSFYSLGFASPYQGDGEYHRIEVRAKRPGLTVRHRDGYLDKSPADLVADRAVSFLLQGWESNPMGVKLQFGEPKKKHRQWQVPVLVRIPGSSVTLLPRGDQMVGRVQIFVTVRDEEGRTSDVTRVAKDLAIPRQQVVDSEGGDLGFGVELQMRPGPASLVIGVWDEIGGSESYVYQKVVVGGPN